MEGAWAFPGKVGKQRATLHLSPTLSQAPLASHLFPFVLCFVSEFNISYEAKGQVQSLLEKTADTGASVDLTGEGLWLTVTRAVSALLEVIFPSCHPHTNTHTHMKTLNYLREHLRLFGHLLGCEINFYITLSNTDSFIIWRFLHLLF